MTESLDYVIVKANNDCLATIKLYVKIILHGLTNLELPHTIPYETV